MFSSTRKKIDMKDILPLQSIVADKSRDEKFIADLERRIEKHVRSTGALKGLVIRNTYAAVKAVRPGYMRHMLKVLSRDYIDAYTPLHEEYRSGQTLPSETIEPLAQFINAHKEEIRTIFWRIADDYGERHKDHMIGKIYAKFKPMIDEHLPVVLSEMTMAIEAVTVVDIEEK